MFRRAVPRLAATSGLAKQIQELRFKTDAPILQCKKAIAECDGDIEKAIAWLRAKGAADSVKKEGRETAFGTLAVCVPKAGSAVSAVATPACVIEVGAETDFAVRNEKFVSWLGTVAHDFEAVIGDAEHAGRADAELLEILVKRAEEPKKALIATIGENVVIKKVWAVPMPEAGLPPRYAETEQPAAFTLGQYVHNSTAAAPTVGNIIGLAGLWSYKAGAAVPAAEADDFAQHLVSHLGDTSDVAAQSFLGSDQTVSQWSKTRAARLRSGFVFKYGMEAPQIVLPKPIEAPKKP